MTAVPSSTYTLSDDAARLEPSVRLLVVPTTDGDDALDRARDAARWMAQQSSGDPKIVLYDRSDERWTDTPNPEGPFGVDEVDHDRRPHLADQMQPFTDAGVDVAVWYASVPALTAMISAVQELNADAILVPEELGRPRIMDRLQAGGDAGEQLERVLDQNLERPVHVFVLADDSDRIDVTTTRDRTDRDQERSEADPDQSTGATS